MLLDNLEEARIVDAAILLELLDLIHDAIQLLLEVLQCRSIASLKLLSLLTLSGRGRQLLELVKGSIGARSKVIHPFLLETSDLLQLYVEDLLAEAVFIFLGPSFAVIVRLVLAQQRLELAVVDVLVLPWRVNGLAEGLAETHRHVGR